MIYPNAHVDYRVYLDGEELIGIANVKMPEISYKTVTTEGAGLMGGVEVPLSGMIDPMSVEINFLSCTDGIIKLGTNEWHDIALYEAFQYFDPVNRTEELSADRFELSIRPTKTNLGTIATASAADASGTYSTCKYAVYKDGEKVVDIDQFSTKHEIGGVDNAAKIRKALGMM
jgi:hypothetical protein